VAAKVLLFLYMLYVSGIFIALLLRFDMRYVYHGLTNTVSGCVLE